MHQTSTIISKHFSVFKKAAIALCVLGFSNTMQAQNVLVVNDNDNITYNSDTLRSCLSHTAYSSYSYWSIPDSAGSAPTAAYMSNYDVVLWYCSGDGVGLKFWGGTTAGNTELVSYVTAGKPLWVIGTDVLYQEYPTTPATFATGEFAKDYMGLTSYDVQSYVDDAGVGTPEADRTATASALFPATLKWQFSTLWYVDGCTASTGTLDLYQMGPSSYTFNGRKCMFHSHADGHNVMSTFFDPALIDSFGNRVNFMEKGITYLLGSTTGLNSAVKNNTFVLYPNPAETEVTINANCEKATVAALEFYDAQGRRVKQQQMQLKTGSNEVGAPIEELGSGLLLVRVVAGDGSVLYTDRLIKQ